MEESVFGMVIDISGLPGPLLNMAILVVSFIGLRLFFHYRAGTSYGFVSRLYALLVGRSEYQDDTLAEFWRRNKELERFNAIFNFKAKSLDDAHKLIKWFDEYDLDHKKFARLKGWFDIEKLEIKKATRTQAVGFMLLGIAFALVSVPPLDLGLRNAALIKFKGESQWIWLDHDQAYNSPYNLTKDWRFTARTCSQETFSAESAAKETQLKTETIASICDSFTNAADAARIDEIIKGQKIFLVFALQFIIFAISSFTEIFRRLTAVETAAYLANRKRIKSEANEQSSSSNARNTEPTQETSEVAS
ncbi:hypothetical protein K3H38_15425 [Aeromonas veronii]|uniref:DUF6216 family protein n=1 Tax=Aeromonas veronii TaxID=654 RepID=UPI001F3B7CE0|nr:DUF6216 family protein [Aeromonas veronii]MCF5884324.1 hypothetical protein [Aeromonas veronii]